MLKETRKLLSNFYLSVILSVLYYYKKHVSYRKAARESYSRKGFPNSDEKEGTQQLKRKFAKISGYIYCYISNLKIFLTFSLFNLRAQN